MQNRKVIKKDYFEKGMVMFFMFIAIIVLMFLVKTYSFQHNISENNKECTDDSNCLNNYCIPNDINCKENCTGTCSPTKKDYCIELPRWYSLDKGTVKPEFGFACPAK